MPALAAPLDLIAGSPWTYAVITGSIAGSAVLPPLPSESVLATATSLAVTGELNLALVCIATTAGALLGDAAAYVLGRSISRQARHRAAALRGPVRAGVAALEGHGPRAAR